MKFKIYRYNEEIDSPSYDVFDVKVVPGLTVLEALFQIQEMFDDSLAFRYSCRGAVCGSCAMLINGIPRLACRSQIPSLIKDEQDIKNYRYPSLKKDASWNSKEEILIEPLPYLSVIKDLVVDMTKFFKYYKLVEPVFKPTTHAPEKERLMKVEDVSQLENYTNCILCASCFGSCNVYEDDPEYLGPAALAKLYRFYLDPREVRQNERLKKADIPNGWWDCKFYGNCTRVCPKGVSPTIAIAKARRELSTKKSNDKDYGN